MPKLKDVIGQPGIKGFTQSIHKIRSLKLPKCAPKFTTTTNTNTEKTTYGHGRVYNGTTPHNYGGGKH